jgi:hypothetical protein
VMWPRVDDEGCHRMEIGERKRAVGKGGRRQEEQSSEES